MYAVQHHQENHSKSWEVSIILIYGTWRIINCNTWIIKQKILLQNDNKRDNYEIKICHETLDKTNMFITNYITSNHNARTLELNLFQNSITIK